MKSCGDLVGEGKADADPAMTHECGHMDDVTRRRANPVIRSLMMHGLTRGPAPLHFLTE